MNILITGGAGYIGSVLVQKLMEGKKLWNNKGYFDHPLSNMISYNKLIVLDNLMYHQSSLYHFCYRQDFEFVLGDVTDKKLLKSLLENADIIIPLAAIVGFPACEKNKELANSINFEHIKFIIENKNPFAKIIYPNTNSGYGVGLDGIYCDEDTPLNPISYYGITKCNAEKLVLDCDGISLRLATVFGVSPRMRLDLLVNDFTYKAWRDKYLVLFEPHFKRNYIHIQDVALTFIFAINNFNIMKGKAYNVGLSDCNISKLELAEEIKKQIPDIVIHCEEFKSDPDKRNYIVSNKRLESCGWSPRYSLKNGITELLKSFKCLSKELNKFTNI